MAEKYYIPILDQPDSICADCVDRKEVEDRLTTGEYCFIRCQILEQLHFNREKIRCKIEKKVCTKTETK